MPELPGEENDSRTAVVGSKRKKTKKDKKSGIKRVSRRQKKRIKKAAAAAAREALPQGAKFSARPLQVDPDDTSSSGSDDSDDADYSDTSVDSDESNAKDNNPHAGTTAPAINWNQGSKRAIRTTLGRPASANNKKPEESKSDSQFEAVNSAYWRSRSDSPPTGNGNNKKDGDVDMEEGEVHENGTAKAARVNSDSDDSGSLDSRADDSIMLNIGSRPGKQNGQVASGDDDDGYNPEPHPILSNGTSGAQNGTAQESSKEEALRNFTRRYPTAPVIIDHLTGKEKSIQLRDMYWNPTGGLESPVRCTECLQKGHIAQMCPSKECAHCGSWNQHDSNFCPSWRRCQRCRERGHDEPQCSSLLKCSTSEVPCDLCASPDHSELECDYMWKLPLRDPPSEPLQVSISCSHCTSNHHILGDCPSLPYSIASSTWTLRGVDPNTITNLNSVLPNRRGGGSMPRGQRGMKIRGRADPRSLSPESDDDMLARPGRRPPLGRPPGRPNIQIRGGIGRGKNLGPSYRDRHDSFMDDRSRQRSMSPGRPGRGRGRGNWDPRSRSPPRRGRPLRGGGPRGPRGGKRGGGNGESYRPLPNSNRSRF